MKCPVCKEVDLVMYDRQGVEIDYCPTCRGVWLDRGELDKIIERSQAFQAAAGDSDDRSRRGYGRNPDHHEDDHRGGGYFGSSHSDHHGRRKSWFAELFD